TFHANGRADVELARGTGLADREQVLAPSARARAGIDLQGRQVAPRCPPRRQNGHRAVHPGAGGVTSLLFLACDGYDERGTLRTECSMGLTFLPLQIANQSDPEHTETVEFLIDSGAIYSVVPRPVLQRLGIAPIGEESFRLASGQTIRRQTAGALFKYG